MKKISISISISLFIALVLFFAFKNNAGSSEFNYQIETAEVELGDVARIVSASGSVRALTTVEVGSQVSGQIIALNADFNSEVTQGQIIAKLDPLSFESRVSSAEADVRSAKANMDVQKAQIGSAEANLLLYENEYKQQAELFEQKLIARSVLDDAQRQLTVGKSELAVSKAQLRAGQAALAQRQASLDSAKVDLERTIIRSPIDGVVIERNVDVGQTVAASLSAPILFTIAQDLQDIRIDADVVESDIGGINKGDPVTYNVDAYPDDEFKGVVEQVRLASQTLQNVVTYTVVIASENQSGRLLPGMTANVEITAEKRSNVLRISDVASRFRPPTDGPQVRNDTEQEQRNSGGARAGGGFATQMLAELNLSEERSKDIQSKIRAEIQKARESLGDRAAFDRNALRQQIASRVDRVLKRNLSEDEYAVYKKSSEARTSSRRIELYQENADGTLSTKPVQVGLSDGSFIEILRGAQAGDKFVTRLLKSSKEQ